MISLSLFLLIVIIFKSITHQWVMASPGWGPWSSWHCTATCGGGGGKKTRQCIDPGPDKCKGGRYKYGKCNEQPCPVVPKPLSNKGWTPWMPWECPVTCGGGRGTRSRICEDPDVCEGPDEENGPCAEQPCPADPDEVDEGLRRQIDQQLKTSMHNFVVQQGDTILIRCKDRIAPILDRENPNAKVSWVHNGQLVEMDDKRIKLERSKDLTVKAAFEDNGLWWCSVALTSKMSTTVSFAAVGVQNEQPDIVVEKGQPFEMKCMATSLSRLVKSKIDQKWIHNASTFRLLKDVRPEKTETLKISSSNFSNSGIWNCRYSESSSSREWVTSVYRVLVIPRKPLFLRILHVAVPIIGCLVVIGVISRLYWKRMKKKGRIVGFEDEEDEYEYEYDEDENESAPLFGDRLRSF